MAKRFLNEIKKFSIHEHEYEKLPKNVKKILENYEDIDFFKEKEIKNYPVKFKSLLKKYLEEIKLNDGKESIGECITLDMLLQLLDRMFAHEIRKLKLEKLLK